MNRPLAHAKSNAVAYLALFVALGGTSYAAVNLPAGSVGNRQLKNHSVSPIKFDRSTIGGYVRYSAQIDSQGNVTASSQKVTVLRWNAGPTGLIGGVLEWRKPVSRGCFALANAESVSPVVSADAILGPGGPHAELEITLSAAAPVDVAVVCPQP